MIDTVEYAKDVVQEGFGEISDRLKGELSDRLMDASVAARGRTRQRRATTRVVVLALVVGGGITAALIVWWWRLRAATEEDVAPDAFGSAVEAERERGIVEHAVRY